jgi:hypothetical protein
MANPLDLPDDGFTYYPMLPFASVSAYDPLVTYPYGVAAAPAYELGFYAIYLPGYTRRPVGLGLGLGSGLGLGLPRTLYPTRTGLTGVGATGVPIYRPPLTHMPTTSRPVVTPHPAVVHVIHR